jgi:hypothetical protein
MEWGLKETLKALLGRGHIAVAEGCSRVGKLALTELREEGGEWSTLSATVIATAATA